MADKASAAETLATVCAHAHKLKQHENILRIGQVFLTNSTPNKRGRDALVPKGTTNYCMKMIFARFCLGVSSVSDSDDFFGSLPRCIAGLAVGRWPPLLPIASEKLKQASHGHAPSHAAVRCINTAHGAHGRVAVRFIDPLGPWRRSNIPGPGIWYLLVLVKY
jgi:hypothetical protein